MMTAAGGAGGMVMPPPSTPVADCPAYKTIGEMDAFFAMRCGSNSACHAPPGPFGDFKAAKVYDRTFNKPSIECKNELLIDPVDPMKSVLWLKTQDPPKCAAGSSIPPRMPSKIPGMDEVPLKPEESTCLQNYLKALAGK